MTSNCYFGAGGVCLCVSVCLGVWVFLCVIYLFLLVSNIFISYVFVDEVISFGFSLPSSIFFMAEFMDRYCLIWF